jgi:ATP-binding cassette subfamily B multidrug efflux pump
VGRLVTRLTSDVDAINDMFTGGILAIVDDFFTLSIMAVVMLSINWWLALLAFSVLPLILVVTRLFRISVRESYRRVRAAIARINSFTQEHVSGMRVVQLFNREQRAYDDFEAVNRLHMIAFKDTIFAYALYYPAVELLSAIAIALVIWRGGFGVLSGSVTIGMLASFNMYSQRFWRPIQDLSDKYNILQAAMAACERIFKLLDTAAETSVPRTRVWATAATASSFATCGSPIRNFGRSNKSRSIVPFCRQIPVMRLPPSTTSSGFSKTFPSPLSPARPSRLWATPAQGRQLSPA